MHRDLFSELVNWATRPTRKPLLLRGARQVGKSWLVSTFGKTFNSYIEINFEKERSAKNWFSGDLEIQKILNIIQLNKQTNIIPGETLLFLDEIQECEAALKSLRYFKEACPTLHVIAAGSLLDFTLDEIGMPVGRVEFMYLYPFSFGEFLTSIHREDLRQLLLLPETITMRDVHFHALLLTLLKQYMILGGMPAVLEQWRQEEDFLLCQRIQDEIIEAYQQDFHKYTKQKQIIYVDSVFNNIPMQLGHKFKYVNIEEQTRSIYFKQALSLLNKASIAHLCYHTKAQSQPLKAMQNEKKFKVFFFDVGLAQRLLGLDTQAFLLKELKLNNVGNIAEQFVAQELIAYSEAHKKSQLHYWHREAKSSNAEVDFLLLHKQKIIPIEVKSGKTGTLRSLQQFLKESPNVKQAIKISQALYSKDALIENIPLYGLEGWLKSLQ